MTIRQKVFDVFVYDLAGVTDVSDAKYVPRPQIKIACNGEPTPYQLSRATRFRKVLWDGYEASRRDGTPYGCVVFNPIDPKRVRRPDEERRIAERRQPNATTNKTVV